jgi:peptidoglycan/xylan/chitin deacetylase (PgdA/CDA1 family)
MLWERPNVLSREAMAAMSKADRLAYFSEVAGLGRLARRLGAWRGILAFTYHRVGFVEGSYDPASWDATPPMFEEQVRFAKKHFDVIGPDELEAAVRVGRGRFVLLTFDDAYHDNFELAFPILKRHGVTATFFVTTGFIDNRQVSWWDEIAWMVNTSPKTELRANGWFDNTLSLTLVERERTAKTLISLYKTLPSGRKQGFMEFLAEATESGRHPSDGREFWMTWEKIRKLRAAGMHIGGHTVTHPVLARLAPDEQEREVVGCKERIEAELGEPMRYFSYPDGGRKSFNEDTRRCLVDNGVEYAFSYYGGYRRFNDWDPHDVRRRWLTRTMVPQRFTMMLALPQIFAWR